jgi:hypothetical protein
MCGPAKDQEAIVVDEPCGCCTSKVEACATGQPDHWTHPDNAKNHHNQEIKDSPGQVLTQSACCDSKAKDIKVCEETDNGCGPSVSKDDCKDGCCDDKNSTNEDDGCLDRCCSVDDIFGKLKEMEDGCCSSTLQQVTFGDNTTWKSACGGSIVVKPIEAGCRIEEETNSTIVTDFGSSAGCCSPQNKVNAVCASTKNNYKSCTNPCPTIPRSDTPKAGCYSKVPLPNTDKTCSIPTSTNFKPSGCCSPIPQVIEPPKKGCCGPETITTDAPLQEGKTSGCCSTTGLTRNDDGACDTKPPNDAGCCSSPKDEVGCGTKSCCTGDSPVKSEKGCCPKRPRKGKIGQSSKSKSRATSLGAFTLQLQHAEMSLQSRNEGRSNVSMLRTKYAQAQSHW